MQTAGLNSRRQWRRELLLGPNYTLTGNAAKAPPPAGAAKAPPPAGVGSSQNLRICLASLFPRAAWRLRTWWTQSRAPPHAAGPKDGLAPLSVGCWEVSSGVRSTHRRSVAEVAPCILWAWASWLLARGFTSTWHCCSPWEARPRSHTPSLPVLELAGPQAAA
jgi:hypothetical protein